jgi:hypothetical protein
MDGKHVRSDIKILSKTTIYMLGGIMDSYFMLLNYKTIFQLLFGKGCKIDLFLSEWLDRIFSNRELYIFQKDNDGTFLAKSFTAITRWSTLSQLLQQKYESRCPR